MAEPIPVTDYKDLSKIFTKNPQNRNPACSKSRLIHALDTETRHGNIFLIADSDGDWLDEITPHNVIKFLFRKKFENTWNFFYNLGYDAEVILKLLGDELFKYKYTRKLKFSFENYSIEYYPNKALKIKKGHHSVSFYDIAQFYVSSLSSAYEKNIGTLPNQYIEMKNKRAEFSKWFYNHNKKKIRNYCIQDCVLTRELSQHWVSLFHSAFEFYPAKWPSSGYLAEKVLINQGVNLPKFDSMSYKIQDLAFRSYFGGRFEMIKRGFIGTAFLYDINSAYPYAISNLPDLTNGRWIRQKSIHKDAKLGFFKILANIPDEKHIPPFAFRANYNIIFPSGEFETYCTLAELQACESKTFYRILEGCQFIPNSDIYPYREFIQKLYKTRLVLKKSSNPLQAPIKIILNSIYGKTGQKVNRIMGNLFNPVIFSYITGFARAQLYNFVVSNNLEKDVVAFATDSVCVTKKLDMDSDVLGEFSFDGAGDDVYYLQNGFYRFNGIWKQRGLGKLGSKEIEHLKTYEKNGKLYYKFNVLRNSRLRSSIIQNKIADIGKIRSIEREVNLNADRKRLWLGRIKDISDKTHNDSSSLSLSLISKDKI